MELPAARDNNKLIGTERQSNKVSHIAIHPLHVSLILEQPSGIFFLADAWMWHVTFFFRGVIVRGNHFV
jgi:hypothetical protein